MILHVKDRDDTVDAFCLNCECNKADTDRFKQPQVRYKQVNCIYLLWMQCGEYQFNEKCLHFHKINIRLKLNKI